MAEVSGRRERGRPRLCLMDGVKAALGNGGMTVVEEMTLALNSLFPLPHYSYQNFVFFICMCDWTIFVDNGYDEGYFS